MLRSRPHRRARDVVRHPALGWAGLGVLYGAGCALNVMLAVSAARMWPFVLAVALGVVAGLCLYEAKRSLRGDRDRP